MSDSLVGSDMCLRDRMKRNGRASLEELQPYLEIANELLCGDSEEEDKK